MLQYDTSPYLIFLVQYKDSGLTLTSAQDIRNRIELLPGGPKWHHQVIIFPPYTTRDPMVLYYWDGLEVIASLFLQSSPQACNGVHALSTGGGRDRSAGIQRVYEWQLCLGLCGACL